MSRSSSMAAGSRPSGRRRPSPATRRRSPVLAAVTPSTATRPPSSWPVTRPRSPPSASCSRPCPPTGRCRCTSRSLTLTPGWRCPTIQARLSSGATCRRAGLRATRSSLPSAARTSPLAPECGWPAKPRRRSASGATSSGSRAVPRPGLGPGLLEARPQWRRRRRLSVPPRGASRRGGIGHVSRDDHPRRRLPSRDDLGRASLGCDCFRRPGRGVFGRLEILDSRVTCGHVAGLG
jgi:hypothetical protein